MKFFRKLIAFALISASVLLEACGDGGNGDANADDTATSPSIVEEKNDSALNSRAAEKDAQFIVDVISSNYGELKLARLAQQKSSSNELKEVAKMLQTDHNAAIIDLKRLASSKGITIPTEENGESKDKLKDLADKKASEFDKDWCETLMDNHRSSISKFENAASTVSDADLRKFVNEVLPKLRTHHDKLMECHKKLK